MYIYIYILYVYMHICTQYMRSLWQGRAICFALQELGPLTCRLLGALTLGARGDEELLLFKCFDSDPQAAARYALHSAP